jgi:capsular polysaccharide biosynthesis protein
VKFVYLDFMIRRFWWLFLVMLPVGLMGGLFLAAIITYVMPKMYESSAVIEVRSNSDFNAPVTNAKTQSFDRIKSREILVNVISRLELANRWSMDKESAIQVLKKIISIEKIPGTDLISILVRHTNKVDAKDVANELARAYREWSNEIQRKESQATLIQLKKAIGDQERKVEESLSKLEEVGRDRKKNIEIDGAVTLLHITESEGYLDAERVHLSNRSHLNDLESKLIEEEIRGFANGSVMIHETAVIPNSPSSPNVTLNLLLGTVAGLLVSPFTALPLMWILNRSVAAKPTHGVAASGQP